MRIDVGGGGGDVLLRPRLGIEVPHHGYQRHIQPAKTWLRCTSDVNLKEPASPSLGGRESRRRTGVVEVFEGG